MRKRVVTIRDGVLQGKRGRNHRKMTKKIIIGVVVVALVVGGAAGGAVYTKK